MSLGGGGEGLRLASTKAGRCNGSPWFVTRATRGPGNAAVSVGNGRFVGSPHYLYKLEWLAALKDTAHKWLADDPSAQIALVGDWNIAPTDEDVWSVEFYQGSTHVTEPERAAFNAVVDAQFSDVVRPFTPGPAIYTYWDYTQLRFPKNRGMRIDFILGSPALAARVTHAEIVREERKGKAPSDHAPVMVELS
jgi:exodeoxyribonuclease III